MRFFEQVEKKVRQLETFKTKHETKIFKKIQIKFVTTMLFLTHIVIYLIIFCKNHKKGQKI